MEVEGERETVTRITALASRAFGVAFHSHSGRWDLLPGEGTCEEMVQMVVDRFGSYLTPENY